MDRTGPGSPCVSPHRVGAEVEQEELLTSGFQAKRPGRPASSRAGLTDVEVLVWLGGGRFRVLNVLVACCLDGHARGLIRAGVHRDHAAQRGGPCTGPGQAEYGAPPAWLAARGALCRSFEFLDLKERGKREGFQKGRKAWPVRLSG